MPVGCLTGTGLSDATDRRRAGSVSVFVAVFMVVLLGATRGVKGYFTEFVTLEDYALGGQDHGASAVSLISP